VSTIFSLYRPAGSILIIVSNLWSNSVDACAVGLCTVGWLYTFYSDVYRDPSIG
jgi:hypothetical protein